MARQSSSTRIRAKNVHVSLCSILSLVVLFSSLESCAAKTEPFKGTGIIKNAWPEFLFGNATEVKGLLEAQGVTVQVEPPRDGSPPFFPGEPEGVWLYTEGSDIIISIPRRGLWHPNRILPGWPDLVGEAYGTAVETILAEELGLAVVYGPEGFPRTLDLNYRRVFLDIAKDGTVARVPGIG